MRPVLLCGIACLAAVAAFDKDHVTYDDIPMRQLQPSGGPSGGPSDGPSDGPDDNVGGGSVSGGGSSSGGGSVSGGGSSSGSVSGGGSSSGGGSVSGGGSSSDGGSVSGGGSTGGNVNSGGNEPSGGTNGGTPDSDDFAGSWESEKTFVTTVETSIADLASFSVDAFKDGLGASMNGTRVSVVPVFKLKMVYTFPAGAEITAEAAAESIASSANVSVDAVTTYVVEARRRLQGRRLNVQVTAEIAAPRSQISTMATDVAEVQIGDVASTGSQASVVVELETTIRGSATAVNEAAPPTAADVVAIFADTGVTITNADVGEVTQTWQTPCPAADSDEVSVVCGTRTLKTDPPLCAGSSCTADECCVAVTAAAGSPSGVAGGADRFRPVIALLSTVAVAILTTV